MSGIANEQALGQLQALLNLGLDTLSENQSVTFQLYQKVVLSQDGYVFWVATNNPFQTTGSLHYATDRLQNEDETLGVNHVVFAAEQQITAFNEINPQTMLIATWTLPTSGETIQIAFSKRGYFYEPAKVWHYSGIAVYPALSSQIIQSYSDLPVGPIVSNSLPVWLALQGNGVTTIPAYASFLLPDNLVPPYVSVHVEPEKTEAIQPFPILNWPGTPSPDTALQPMSSDQLMRDVVRFTFYGLTNQQAIQYLANIMQYSLDTDAFGFQSMPAIRDDKRPQVEIAAIAMKKTLELDISYYQSTSDAMARRLILSVLEPNITLA